MPNDLINTLTIEIDSGASALDIGQECEICYEKNMLPVIQKVFTKHAEQYIVIDDSIMIDLGEVSEDELAYKLEQLLESELAHYSNTSSNNISHSEHDVVALSMNNEKFDMLEFFIKYLQIPHLHWAFEDSKHVELNLVFQKAIQEIIHSDQYANRIINTISSQVGICRRFVYIVAAFDEFEVVIKRLIAILTPHTAMLFAKIFLLIDKVAIQNKKEILKQAVSFSLENLFFDTVLIPDTISSSYFYNNNTTENKLSVVFLSKKLTSEEVLVVEKIITPMLNSLLVEEIVKISEVKDFFDGESIAYCLSVDKDVERKGQENLLELDKVTNRHTHQQMDTFAEGEKLIDKGIATKLEKKSNDALSNQFTHLQSDDSTKSQISKLEKGSNETSSNQFTHLQSDDSTKSQISKLEKGSNETSSNQLVPLLQISTDEEQKSNSEIMDVVKNKEHDSKNVISVDNQELVLGRNVENLSLPENIERIPVYNSGLILLQPFLITFFDKLGLLINRNSFKSIEHQTKAILILQEVVGSQGECFEYLLFLNKIICGMNVMLPIDVHYKVSQQEKDEIESMIMSVIKHWEIIKNTSVRGFQTSFLQRKGYLEKSSQDWVLRVENKSIDVLLADLPWNMNVISLPWNDYLIHVDWKN